MSPLRGEGLGALGGRPPRATLAIMVATGLVSAVALAGRGWGELPVAEFLALVPGRVLHGQAWSLLTYLFLEQDPVGLLWHLLMLWMFAGQLERVWGERRFLVYFLGTGVGAAAFTTLLALEFPALRGADYSGAYVVSEAMVLGYALYFWNSRVYLLIFPIQAKYLLVPSLAIPALNILRGVVVPFVPVLLGMVIGFGMLRRSGSGRRGYLRLRAWWIERKLRRRAKHLRVVPDDRAKKGSEGHGPYLH